MADSRAAGKRLSPEVRGRAIELRHFDEVVPMTKNVTDECELARQCMFAIGNANGFGLHAKLDSAN